jgi:hypothetical protein
MPGSSLAKLGYERQGCVSFASLHEHTMVAHGVMAIAVTVAVAELR